MFDEPEKCETLQQRSECAVTGLIITSLLFPIAGCIAGRRPLAECFLSGVGIVGGNWRAQLSAAVSSNNGTVIDSLNISTMNNVPATIQTTSVNYIFIPNIQIAGGGSGHGFKHGPALGEYLSGRILHDVPAEPRLSLASKQSVRMRVVY